MSLASTGAVMVRDAIATVTRQPHPRDDGQGEGLFDPRLRRTALVWICVSLPVVGASSVWATTTDRYLVLFAVLASGAYTTPALLFTYLAARRAPRPDNWCWWLWLSAVVLMYGIGCSMIYGAATGSTVPSWVSAVAVAITALLVMAVVVWAVRTRSGRRAVTVDLVESVMSVVMVTAASGIVWGDDVLAADDDWYAVPAALAAVAMVFGVYWAVLLWVRLRGDRSSGAIGLVAVLLAVVGLVNAVAQTAQGITGFELPSAPLLGVHALCMSLLMLVPLYVPDTVGPGLDRLPPQHQVRGAWLPAVLVLAGLPNVLLVGVAERHEQPDAPAYALAAVAVVLVLAIVRQLVTARETQRLYAEVERAAESRRELLAQLMERTDEDRHRVAAQLHEQAVSAYASFVSFVQAHAGSAVDRREVSGAALIRDDLRGQAESLRQLMLAVRPLEVDRPRSTSLATPVRAYVDGLYRDRPPPVLQVTVADDVVLDWTTETLVLRIVQEAVRNVWRHSRAARIDVEVRGDGAAVEVSVRDDGVGFAPGAVMFESGIAAMRGFAALGQGRLRIDSRPGHGTRVVARLGDVPSVASGACARDVGEATVPPPAGRPVARSLRLVRSDALLGEA
jgi:signal transduction histidine kinase